MPHLLPCFAGAVLLAVAFSGAADAEEANSRDLPFDRGRINRYSLDHLPRSISIRQGSDRWLGYDLQRAKLYKAWQAPSGEPGLKASGFTVRSVGQTWYEDRSEETWRLERAGEIAPLTVRYLGCSQRETHFELSWHLTLGAEVMTLRERVPLAEAEQTVREIRIDSLPRGSQLLPPRPTQNGWELKNPEGELAGGLSDSKWYRISSR